MKNMVVILAAMWLAVVSSQAVAQNRNCAPREVVIDRLAEQYQETRQNIGLGGQGMVMETFASLETGTWTITVTAPNGLTCLMASGQSYETLSEELPNTDDQL